MIPEASHFTSIWIVVVATQLLPGELLLPLGLAAKRLGIDADVALDADGLQKLRQPPYPTDARTLLVTIGASDLVGCHIALGWRTPDRIVDLLVEFRTSSNGHPGLRVGGLVGALIWFGRPIPQVPIDSAAPGNLSQKLAVAADLFDGIGTTLNLGIALLRGRYMSAVARIEAVGVPVDQPTLEALASDWPALRARIAEIVDQGRGIFRGSRLDTAHFEEWLNCAGIGWPHDWAGRLDLSEDAFRDMARAHREVRAIKELRTTLIRFVPGALTVGRDGRNRTPLRPFASKTGRNQPSAKASIFGSAAWVRRLIRPEPGNGLALLDWEQQEFGVAAALSGDTAMQGAYRSGDPYLALAVLAGAAPTYATPDSHSDVRARFKVCALGVQYGMGVAMLARLTGGSEADARDLLQRHRATFPDFWSWSERVETHGRLTGRLTSVFGWQIVVGPEAKATSLRNFPLQANGAEMLRLACCLIVEAGIAVCMPIHDALLIEAPLDDLDDAIATARRLMAEASSIVLEGFALRTSVQACRAPDRWSDQRGTAVWSAVLQAIEERVAPAHGRHATRAPAHSRPISYCLSHR